MSTNESVIQQPIKFFADVADEIGRRLRTDASAGRAVVSRRDGSYRQWDPNVLAADEWAEHIVFDRLQREASSTNEIVVFSEEAGKVVLGADENDLSNPYYLIMDPLDGSLLYQRDIEAFWGISFGLWKGDEHQASYVANLLTGRRWQAADSSIVERYEGSTVDLTEGPSAISADRLEEACIATYLMKPHYLKGAIQGYGPLLNEAHFVLPVGGCFGWVYAASGRIDAYLALHQPLTEVYSALGIAQEAGCIITDLQGREPVFKPNIDERYSLLCTRNEKLHDAMLARIARL